MAGACFRQRFHIVAALVAMMEGVGALTVVSPPDLVTGKVYDTAYFQYYGNPAAGPLRAPAVVLDGASLCTVDPTTVEGKIIIIGDRWPRFSVETDCGITQSLGEVYERFNKVGAVALVFASHLDFFPTGSLIYHYETWDRCRFCGDAMRLVHVETKALDAFSKWELHAGAFEVELEPKAQIKFRRIFNSWSWLFGYRIFLPVIAFATSTEAASELWRLRQSKEVRMTPSEREARRVSLAVCSIELPAMVLLGSGVALGLYGPYDVPVQVANTMYGALQGAGILTTFVLGLHLSEESRLLQGVGLERRPIFEKYPRVLACVGLATVGPDLSAIALSITCYYFVHRVKSLSVSMMVLYAFLQGGAGLYFIFKTYAVQQPMVEYLKNVRMRGTQNQDSLNKIGRLMFWLTASGVAMILAWGGMLFSSIVMAQGIKDSNIMWSIAVFYVVFLRIIVSAAQINAVRPAASTSPILFVYRRMASYCSIYLIKPAGILYQSLVSTTESRVAPSALSVDSASNGAQEQRADQQISFNNMELSTLSPPPAAKEGDGVSF